jgi:hypothetical protein
MKGGKYCVVFSVACLMVVCGAFGVFAQAVVGLVADPAELDFGVVYIGDSATDTVTVTNTGSIVSIVDILIDLNWAGAYSVVGQPTLPYPLGPGESMDVMVQYTPPDFSFHRAELNVVSRCRRFTYSSPLGSRRLSAGLPAPACRLRWPVCRPQY